MIALGTDAVFPMCCYWREYSCITAESATEGVTRASHIFTEYPAHSPEI